MGKKDIKRSGDLRVPKVKCCVSKDRCGRCPIRLLAEGNLPDGYTVKKRKVVRCEPLLVTKKGKKSAKTTKLATKKITKSELEKAVKRTKRSRKLAKAA